jgi:hypothetical protein
MEKPRASFKAVITIPFWVDEPTYVVKLLKSYGIGCIIERVLYDNTLEKDLKKKISS